MATLCDKIQYFSNNYGEHPVDYEIRAKKEGACIWTKYLCNILIEHFKPQESHQRGILGPSDSHFTHPDLSLHWGYTKNWG